MILAAVFWGLLYGALIVYGWTYFFGDRRALVDSETDRFISEDAHA